MTRLRDPARPVDDHPGRRGHALIPRECEVNELAGPVGQVVQLRRGLMAEHRMGSGPEHGRPEPGMAARIPGEGGIHPEVKLLPAPAANSASYRVRAESGIKRLLARNHATLELG
jgi:hypothetical protein